MSGSSDSDDSDQEFELQHMRNSRSLLVIISLILVAILTHLSDGAPVQVYDPTLRIDRNNLGQDNVAYLNAVLREMLGAEIRQDSWSAAPTLRRTSQCKKFCCCTCGSSRTASPGTRTESWVQCDLSLRTSKGCGTLLHH